MEISYLHHIIIVQLNSVLCLLISVEMYVQSRYPLLVLELYAHVSVYW